MKIEDMDADQLRDFLLDGTVQKFRRFFQFAVKPCNLSLMQQRARMFLQRSIGYLFRKQSK